MPINHDFFLLLFLAGIFNGLAFFFRFYETLAFFFALVLVIFLDCNSKKKTFFISLKSILCFSSGTLLVLGIGSLFFIDIIQKMFNEVILGSILHGTSLNRFYFTNSITLWNKIFTDFEILFESGNYKMVLIIFYHFIHLLNVSLASILPFIVSAIVIWYLAGKKLIETNKSLIFFFFFWGIFSFPKALGRSDMSHLAPSITPLFFLVIYFLQTYFRCADKNKNTMDNLVKRCLLIITFILLSPVPLFFAKSGYSLLKTPYKVSTAHGTLLFHNKPEADDVNNLIQFINKNSDEKDYIFVTPWFSPPLYALTNRKNPTYYDSMVDLISQPSIQKQNEVCNSLLNKSTKMIIHYPDWGFDGKKELQFLYACPVLQKCIENNFNLKKKFGNYWVYLAKNK